MFLKETFIKMSAMLCSTVLKRQNLLPILGLKYMAYKIIHEYSAINRQIKHTCIWRVQTVGLRLFIKKVLGLGALLGIRRVLGGNTSLRWAIRPLQVLGK